MHFLHTMIRALDEEATLRFFVEGLGLQIDARKDFEKGRFTLIFLSTGAPEDRAQIELTINWDQTEPYTGGRNFGHVAFAVPDIYARCAHLQSMGYIIHRPPHDGRMAFVKSPDGISVELLQHGDALPPQEPWKSMDNTGTW